MRDTASYREEIVERLRDVLDARDRSVASVERELGRGRGYVSDALRGDKRLYVEMILEVLELLEIPPERFFGPPFGYASGLSSRPRTGDATSEVSEPADAGPLPASPLVEQESLLVRALVVALDQRGILPIDELLRVCRDLDRAHGSELRSDAG